MTHKALLNKMSEMLTVAEVSDASNDAWLIMSEVTGMDRGKYFIHMMDQVSPEVEDRLMDYTKRRVEHEPLQYILGKAYFMGYEFLVNPSVLIPRFDTEVLVEYGLKLVQPGDNILDMCTGSGCIGITMALMSNAASVTAVDLSPEALEVARINSDRLDASVKLVNSDMFDQVEGRYDMVLSNPPYIRTEVIKGLDIEVKDKEPYMALDGGEDGLVFYRILAEKGYEHLNDGGHIILEIGYDQAAAVKVLLEENKFTDIQVVKDLAGLDRVVCGRRK